jgi:Ca2+-binding RTX toxin-like protein
MSTAGIGADSNDIKAVDLFRFEFDSATVDAVNVSFFKAVPASGLDVKIDYGSGLVAVSYAVSADGKTITINAPVGQYIDTLQLTSLEEGDKITDMGFYDTANGLNPALTLQYQGVDNDGDPVSGDISISFYGAGDADLTLTGSNLVGDVGSDTLIGTIGNDTISGLAGQDTLTGGLGNDDLTGGAGSDTFVWKLSDTGSDKITDFNLAPVANGGDVLDLKDLLVGEHSNPTSLDAYLHFSAEAVTGKTVITVDANAGLAGGTGQTITLTNVAFSDLQSDYGTTDAAIITKLLADGNLKTDI